MKTNDHKALKHSYRDIVEIVTTVVNEVTQIVAKINEVNTPTALAEVMSGVFSKEFESELFSIEACMPVASRLFVALKARGLK